MPVFARVLLIVSLFASLPAMAVETPPGFADLVEKLTPAVVNVSTTQKVKANTQGMTLETPDGGELPEEFRDFFEQFRKLHRGAKPLNQDGDDQPDEDHEVYSLGSGFIIDPDGYIATNNHVIDDAEEIFVILSDNTKLKAKIIARDVKTDLALLKVEADHKLPYVPLGDSDASRVGDWVIAIGNPFGLGGTVTAGIISARARNIGAGPFDDFIQTDAAINRGNSGGPMFNMKGEVIGINTAIFSPSGGSVGIGFAVPTSLAKPVFEQLRKTGHINRGWLGVKIEPVTDEIADSVGLKKASGAFVLEVTKGGPAEKAGLAVGDIVTRFNGKDVKEMRNLPRMVADTAIGAVVPVEIWHKGASRTVTVTLGELKDEQEKAEKAENDEGSASPGANVRTTSVLGLSVATLTPELRQKYGIAASIKGVVITKIKPGTEIARRGLHPGDVITQTGEDPVANAKELIEAVSTARKDGHKFLLVRIQRGEDSNFVTLPLGEEKK